MGEERAKIGTNSLYHIAQGTVTRLFADISMPDSIFFFPEDTTGYYVDTKVNKPMRVPFDTQISFSASKAEVSIDSAGVKGSIDGAA